MSIFLLMLYELNNSVGILKCNDLLFVKLMLKFKFQKSKVPVIEKKMIENITGKLFFALFLRNPASFYEGKNSYSYDWLYMMDNITAPLLVIYWDISQLFCPFEQFHHENIGHSTDAIFNSSIMWLLDAEFYYINEVLCP